MRQKKTIALGLATFGFDESTEQSSEKLDPAAGRCDVDGQSGRWCLVQPKFPK